MWNATGIAYNRAQTPEPRGWAALWNPNAARTPDHAGRSRRRHRRLSAKARLPFGSIDERQLQAAKAEAVEQKRLLRAYLNAEVRDQLVAGDVLAAQLWSTTAAQAIHGNPNLGFVYPEEGYPLYCDCAVILRESSRYELAHEFLEFLLQPDVAAANATAAETATANGARRPCSRATRYFTLPTKSTAAEYGRQRCPPPRNAIATACGPKSNPRSLPNPGKNKPSSPAQSGR